MQRLRQLFCDHPASVGETYSEHLCSALRFSAALLAAALCCLVHAVLPFLCERSGSRRVSQLHARMVQHRDRTDLRKSRRLRMRAGLSPRPFAIAGTPLGIGPGLALCLIIAGLSFAGAEWLGRGILQMPASPISPAAIAVLIGLAARHFVSRSTVVNAGVSVAAGALLKIGIALLGFRLSFMMVFDIGLRAVPVILGCIASALIVVNLLARSWRVTPRLATLIAVGTSICGATAIAAAAPCIRARSTEVSYAITCVVVFGLVGMLAYPFVAHWLFDGSGIRAGLFLGTAVHDTAQVIGAGLAYSQVFADSAALDYATVTKLLRNLCMLAVIPAPTVAFRRNDGACCDSRPVVPLFILAFVALSLLRTLGDWVVAASEFVPPSLWQDLIGLSQLVATLLLTAAMAAIGYSTRLDQIRGLGLVPMALGFTAALTVGGVSAILIRLGG